MFDLGDDLRSYEREVPRKGEQRKDAPRPRANTPPAAGNSQPQNGAEAAEGEADTRPCLSCKDRTVHGRRTGEWFGECWQCSQGKGAGQNAEPRNAKTNGKGVPAADITACIRCGNAKQTGGDCNGCAKQQSSGANGDVIAMIDRLPAGEPERRHLWESARRGGLD